MDLERKRLNIAEKHILTWFSEIKKCLEKEEDAIFCEKLPQTKVKVAKEKMLVKKTIQFLFEEAASTFKDIEREQGNKINKNVFIKFVQVFLTGIVEGELGDMFLAFMKKLGVNQ